MKHMNDGISQIGVKSNTIWRMLDSISSHLRESGTHVVWEGMQAHKTVENQA